jgi:hypothetical protein
MLPLDDQAPAGAGVDFSVEFSTRQGQRTVLFEKHLDAGHRPGEPSFQDLAIQFQSDGGTITKNSASSKHDLSF